jgi:hypothetical protein
MNSTAYKELVTKHNTFSYVTPYGRVAARKDRGQYEVTIERYDEAHTDRMTFKTFRGCIIAFEGAKRLI